MNDEYLEPKRLRPTTNLIQSERGLRLDIKQVMLCGIVSVDLWVG